MAYTLEAFCRDCAASLRADPGVGGKEQIRRDLERLLAEKAFVAAHCGSDAKLGVHVLYRDPELGPEYAAAMDFLFDTYAESLPRVSDWVDSTFPAAPAR